MKFVTIPNAILFCVFSEVILYKILYLRKAQSIKKEFHRTIIFF